MEFINLYNSLVNKISSETPAGDKSLDHVGITNVDLLFEIKAEHISEIKCPKYSFAALILMIYGKKEFYRIADLIIYRIDDRVFEWIMGGKVENWYFAHEHHPINLGILDLDEALDAIENYYDYQIELIYPVLARSIIGRDKKCGRKKIIDAMEAHGWSKPETNTLDFIYGELYGESPNLSLIHI